MARLIVVHDYAGYPFTLQLAEVFAAQGFRVVYFHLADLQSLKAGCMAESELRGRLQIQAISLGEAFHKDGLLTRRRQDLKYAAMVCQQIASIKPDVVISANTPLEVQDKLQDAARRCGARFYFWMQDVYSIAVQRLLPKKLPILGHCVGWYYEWLERRLLRSADGNILITADFLPMVQSWGVDPARCTVIQNWAPLVEQESAERYDSWRKENGLQGKTIMLYAGTLGMKHSPRLLIALAEGIAKVPDAMVVVVSSGKAASWIAQEGQRLGLQNLKVLPFRPVGEFQTMLAAAGVLLCILEPEAGSFSVPSKVLSYLVAGRPILMAIPHQNLAHRIVIDTGAGLAAPPTDESAFVAAGVQLLNDAELRRRCGTAGRQYAEQHFEIGRIALRFCEAMSLDSVESHTSG
jgi:glycosyltransferase involved in cell wall biosynthesis